MPKIKCQSKLKSVKVPPKRGPVWKGPSEDGITQSLLSRFLCCRERFRLLVVEGLKPEEQFNARIEYGNLWHACEEALARTSWADSGRIKMVKPHRAEWEDDLRKCAIEMAARYPLQQEQVQHWYRVCQVQFPLYVEWWRQHPDMLQRTPLLQEQVFAVDYELPSGRHVKLRGKFDSVDIVGDGKKARVFLQENKTKGDIDPYLMQRNLTFDLQTMIYCVALREYDLASLENPALDRIVKQVGARDMFGGVRYNVIRRPLSGGRHTIRKHKPTKSNPLGETDDEFYARLANLMATECLEPDGSHYYFMRWNVEILPHHVEDFRRQCLDPVLEQLWDWWDWVTNHPDPYIQDPSVKYQSNCDHFRFPYGVFNPALEGNASDLDEYLATGSEVGLRRVENLFPEL